MDSYSTKTIITLSIIAMFWSLNVSARRDALRALGGNHDVRPGDFPYVVRLELQLAYELPNSGVITKHEHLCTASALSPTAVLTAKHCYLEPMGETYAEDFRLEYMKPVIRYGSAPGVANTTAEFDKFSDVLECLQLPSARDSMDLTMSDDLAVLRTQPIRLSVYGRISALDYQTLYGFRVASVGYGLTNDRQEIGDTLELGLPLQVLDGVLMKCQEDYYPFLCVGYPTGNVGSVCPGDSGGPVIHATGIVGVLSMGSDGACDLVPKPDTPMPRYQSLIHPLSSHINWLSKTLKELT